MSKRNGSVSFKVKDSRGTRTLVVPVDEPAFSGDPTPIVRDIEARTRTRLRDGENPVKFIRTHRNFMERRDHNSNVSFAEYCSARHSEWIDVYTESPVKWVTHDEIVPTYTSKGTLARWKKNNPGWARKPTAEERRQARMKGVKLLYNLAAIQHHANTRD